MTRWRKGVYRPATVPAASAARCRSDRQGTAFLSWLRLGGPQAAKQPKPMRLADALYDDVI